MKKFIGLIASLFLAFIIIGVGQFIGQMIFPSPHEIDWNDLLRSLRILVGGMPLELLIFNVLIHALGSLAGGLVLGRILQEDTMNVGITLGGILTALGMISMVSLNFPEWYYLDLLMYMPPAIFGANYTSKL